MNLGTLMLVLTANTTGLDSTTGSIRKFETAVTTSTAGMNKQFQSLEQAMMVMGRTMTQYVTLPLSLIGIAVTKTFADFEYTIAKITGLVGIAGDQTKEWGEQILALSSSVGKGPTELAEALYFVTSSGFTTAEAMNIVTASAKAASAGLGDTKAIADTVTSAMNAYGAANLQASYAVDILTATVREGKGEAPELVRAFGQVIPIASKLGVSFDQVGGAIAAMTRSGASAANASTYLRQMLFTLLKPTQDSEAALKQMGLTSQKLRDIIRNEGLLNALVLLEEKSKGFGETMIKSVFPNVRAYLGEANLMGANLKENIALFDRVKNSVGDTAKAFEAVSGTLQFRFNQVLSEGKVMFIRFGEAIARNLIPFLETLMSTMKDVQHWFANLNPAVQDSILKFAGFAAAVGPVLLVLNLLKGAFLTPIIGIFGALIGVVGKAAMVFKLVAAETKVMTAAMSLANIGSSGLKTVTALLAGNIQVAGMAFRSFTVSLLACPYTWVVAGLVAIGAALYAVYKKSNELTEAEKVRMEVQTRVVDSVAEEKFQLERLLRVASDAHATENQRKIAIQELNKLMPFYNGQITEETVKTGQAAKMVGAYIDMLKKKYSMQAMEEMAVEEEKKYWKAVESGQNKTLSFWETLEAGAGPRTFANSFKDAVSGPLALVRKIANFSENVQAAKENKAEKMAADHKARMETLYADITKLQNQVGPSIQEIQVTAKAPPITTPDFSSNGLSKSQLKELEETQAKLEEFTAIKYLFDKSVKDSSKVSFLNEKSFANYSKGINETSNAMTGLHSSLKDIDTYAKLAGDSFDIISAKIEVTENTIDALKKTIGPGKIFDPSTFNVIQILQNQLAGFKSEQFQNKLNTLNQEIKGNIYDTTLWESKLSLLQTRFREVLKAKPQEGDLTAWKNYLQDIGSELGKVELKLKLLTSLKSTMGDVFSGIGEAVGKGLAGTKNAFDSLLDIILTAVQQIGQTLIAVGTGLMFMGPLMKVKALKYIIGGMAIVALASGLSAARTMKKSKAEGMAAGGIVPAGYPNDSYPAMLTSGEIVIPPAKLPEFERQPTEIRVLVEGVIKGTDIHYINREIERKFKNSY